MRRWLLIAALPLLLGASAGASIDVAVTGVRLAKGRVRVSICDQATFLEDCRWNADAPAVKGTTIVTVRNVPPGRYGAQGFHDKNDNDKVDRGLFGIPLEGVGFSNDARIRMSPPKFEEAAFQHGGANQRITFKLRYFV
jgi:uncharacterized protein (DUF2141 family)